MGTPHAGVILDSSAVIVLLRGEASAADVEQLLREQRVARMSTVNAAETIDVLVRVHGRAVDKVVATVEQLFAAGVEAVAPSLEQAVEAGEMRARTFVRRSRRVSLADCFVLTTAAAGETIVTTDAVLADVARAEGIAVVLLGA